jgi:hypothetical protein
LPSVITYHGFKKNQVLIPYLDVSDIELNLSILNSLLIVSFVYLSAATVVPQRRLVKTPITDIY